MEKAGYVGMLSTKCKQTLKQTNKMQTKKQPRKQTTTSPEKFHFPAAATCLLFAHTPITPVYHQFQKPAILWARK